MDRFPDPFSASLEAVVDPDRQLPTYGPRGEGTRFAAHRAALRSRDDVRLVEPADPRIGAAGMDELGPAWHGGNITLNGMVGPASPEGQMSSRSSFVRWLFEEVWSQGQTETLASRIGPLTFHYAGAARQTDGGELALIIDRWREGFPDLRFSVEDLIEQGDRVAVRARLQGTHLGPWRDLPASGRRMDIDVAMFFRWERGQIVEIWEVDDAARRDQQLKDPSPP